LTTAPTIGFAGLTHLGINSAAAAAARGFPVVGFDPDPQVIERIAAGEMPVVEPDLEETVAAHGANMDFTAAANALGTCDMVYVAVDVPTDETGASDLVPIRAIIDLVNANMRDDALLVILCQVPPGFTRTVRRPVHTLFYQVETLIFGRAMERALHPERFIVGCARPEAPLPDALSAFLAAFDCPVLPMRYESAELAKISINMCLVASISAANTLAEICENVGADWSEIVPSLRLDRRIGEHSYIQPGLGIAGGNLERDLATVLRLAEAHQTDGGVVSAWVANSKHRKSWVRRVLDREILAADPGARLGVLGLAYKENTASTKNAPALALLEALPDTPVRVFDPAVPEIPLAANTERVASAMDAAEGCDALVVMTPWPEFRDLDLAELAGRMKGCLLIDPYRVFSPGDAEDAGLAYHTLGFSASPGAAASSGGNECSNI